MFAYNTIINEEVRPRLDSYKWTNIKIHLDRCREYREIYLQRLTNKLTNDEEQRAQVEYSDFSSLECLPSSRNWKRSSTYLT